MAAEILLWNEVEQEIAVNSLTEFNEKWRSNPPSSKRGHAQRKTLTFQLNLVQFRARVQFLNVK